MKRFIPALIGFGLGVLLTSAGWAFYTFKKQTELAIYYVSTLHGHATVSKSMLTFLETPDPRIGRRLAFAASNSVALFPKDLAAWDEEYPYVRFKARYAEEIERFEKFMRDRAARAAATNTVQDR